MAAINSVHYVRGKEPLILDRSQAYIGVLIDDLVTRGTKEPYRLFTSRAEYRLLLREDNADSRLCDIGHDIGLLDKESYHNYRPTKASIDEGVNFLSSTFVKSSTEISNALENMGSAKLKQKSSLADLLRRPEITLERIAELPLDGDILDPLIELKNSAVHDEVQLQIKFKGYIDRQQEQVDRFKKLEALTLPDSLDYSTLSGLSAEVVEKLTNIRPRSLGQASRISGITPAAISILQVHLRKRR
jgi:tRNA uridine 5-carboxymethylaminomethyl modification enzyme